MQVLLRAGETEVIRTRGATVPRSSGPHRMLPVIPSFGTGLLFGPLRGALCFKLLVCSYSPAVSWLSCRFPAPFLLASKMQPQHPLSALTQSAIEGQFSRRTCPQLFLSLAPGTPSVSLGKQRGKTTYSKSPGTHLQTSSSGVLTLAAVCPH